jgi:hypothetical protein
MGRNIRLFAAQVTAAATFANGGTAMTAVTGDSLKFDLQRAGG